MAGDWCNSTDSEPVYSDHGFVGLGSYIVYCVSVSLHLLCTHFFKVRISISLLRHCAIQDIKNSARNAWTNIGVTSSLVMTTVVGALIEGRERRHPHTHPRRLGEPAFGITGPVKQEIRHDPQPNPNVNRPDRSDFRAATPNQGGALDFSVHLPRFSDECRRTNDGFEVTTPPEVVNIDH